MGNGREQIQSAFAAAGARGSAALMPYFTLGYPDRETSLAVIAAAAAGSDLLELGIPFSDPLADGPTIQRSTQVALEKGTTVKGCLEMAAQLRAEGMETPACFMGYYNPLLAYGLARFVQDAREAGIQGVIVPDLPPEEAGELAGLCEEAGLAYVYFLAPTSNQERIEQVTAKANGFLYLVSVTGVTGARSDLHSDLGAFIARVRAQTDIPLAVGFGISTAEQAAAVGALADGVIIGSALVTAVNEAEDKPAAAGAFVETIGAALRK